MENRKIAVVGGGSWATAIAKILLHTHDSLLWWVREDEIREGLTQNGVNPLYLSSIEFPKERIYVSSDINEVVRKADTLVLVVPSVYLSSVWADLDPELLQDKRICSAVKGIVPDSDQVVCEYLRDHFGIKEENMSVISGPSHAEEIALGRLTYLTAASTDPEHAEYISRCFSCSYVQTRCSDDLYGIEYAAVLKNVYALAAGIARGLGYGDNFVAVLVSKALEETRLFLSSLHDIERNLNSAPYAGDLLVTAYSQFSRNRTFGTMIGSGYSVKSAMLEMKMVAEGYYASGSLNVVKRDLDVKMPIFEAVHDILYKNFSPRKTFSKLEKLL